jgi:hypothetical protein
MGDSPIGGHKQWSPGGTRVGYTEGCPPRRVRQGVPLRGVPQMVSVCVSPKWGPQTVVPQRGSPYWFPQRWVREGGLPTWGPPRRVPQGLVKQVGLSRGGPPRGIHQGGSTEWGSPKWVPRGGHPSVVHLGLLHDGFPKWCLPRGVRQGWSPEGVP